jgi:hypothetical protein
VSLFGVSNLSTPLKVSRGLKPRTSSLGDELSERDFLPVSGRSTATCCLVPSSCTFSSLRVWIKGYSHLHSTRYYPKRLETSILVYQPIQSPQCLTQRIQHTEPLTSPHSSPCAQSQHFPSLQASQTDESLERATVVHVVKTDGYVPIVT